MSAVAKRLRRSITAFLFLLVLPVTIQARPDIKEPPCDPIRRATEIVQPGRVVLLGELHGSVEVPLFVDDLVCLALSYGHAVAVGLEIPLEEEKSVSDYLQSDGSANAQAAFLAGELWQNPFKDGRSSQAVLELIDSLRVKVQNGERIEIVLIDTATGVDRDQFMARQLKEAIERLPNHFFLVLTGNLHNRMVPGLPWDPKHEPMGVLLAKNRPRNQIISLNLSHPDGEAWFCTGGSETCGAHPVSGSGEADAQEIRLFEATSETGYDGLFLVESLNASPPASNLVEKD